MSSAENQSIKNNMNANYLDEIETSIDLVPARMTRRDLLGWIGLLGLGGIAGYVLGNYFPYISVEPVGEKVRAVIGTQWPMPSFDQLHYKMGKGGMLVTDLVFEKTFVNDFQGNVAARSALGMPEASEDKLTVWFNLKEDIKFHDGSAYTAEDVAESYEWMLDESPRAGYYRSIESIEAEETHRVRFDLNTKDVTFFWFNQWFECILPSGTRDRVDSEEINLDMPPDEIMSGPVTIAEFEPDQYCLLEKSEGYYGTLDSADEMCRPPAVDEIEFRIIKEASTLVASMHTGETDMITWVPFKDFESLSDRPNFYGLTAPSSLSFGSMYGFNHRRQPFDDVNVRQAFAWSIDRQEIVDLVYYGFAEVSPTATSPKAWYYSETASDMVGYDLEKAREYLYEAGLPDGFDMTVAFRQDPELVAVNELVKSQVAEVGINMQLDPMEAGTFFGVRSSGDFDVFYDEWTACFDAGMIYPQYTYADGSYNVWIGWEAPERAVELCQLGAQFTDNETRYPYYEELQEIFMQEMPLVFTHTPMSLNLLQTYVKGYRNAWGGQPHFNELRIEEE